MSRNILQGLVGAWCPSLGPSGYTLLDRSGRGQHGTLQNMDAASDWVGTPTGWALDFDGVNDKVVASHGLGTGVATATFGFWAHKASAGSIAICSIGSETSNSRFHTSWFSDGNVYCTAENGSGSFGSVALSYSNTMIHFVMAYDGGQSTNATRLRLYVNGREQTLSFSGTIPSTAISSSVVAIGAGSGVYAAAKIADVSLFRSALNSTQVWQLFQLGPSGLGRLLTPQRRSYAFRVPAAGNRRRRIICGSEC
jgi:hypothetical protein